MTIPELVYAIGEKHKDNGFNLWLPLSSDRMADFERQIGFTLPDDFKTLYSICNGFEMNEDIFRFANIDEILEYNVDKKEKNFHFADYMIYSDTWTLQYSGEGDYKIVNINDTVIVLTDSLAEFLSRFLAGGVFEKGGLYDWHEEIKRATP